MRAFLSCSLPKDISDYLVTLSSLLPKENLTFPKHYDLTVKFFGDIPDRFIPAACSRLSQLHFLPFQANLSHVGVFSEQTVRVVWVGVKPTHLFCNLHTLVDEALFPLFPKDARFFPHITLARVKLLHNKNSFLKALKGIPVESKSFLVQKLTLFKSEQTANGALHTPLCDVSC